LGFSAAATATRLPISCASAMSITAVARHGECGAGGIVGFWTSFSNYTEMLIGATAIPVWNQNVAELPIHFGASGLSAAVGMLELMGHRKSRALQMLGSELRFFESWEGWRIESRQQPARGSAQTRAKR